MNLNGFRQPKKGLWHLDFAQFHSPVPEPPRFAVPWKAVGLVALFTVLGYLLPWDWAALHFLPLFGAVTALPWTQYTEAVVGLNHPVLTDTDNRSLRAMLSRSGFGPDALFYGLPVGSSVVNAGSSDFTGTADARVNAAIVAAGAASPAKKFVFVPNYAWDGLAMLPYNASLVSFNTAVQMICEGSNPNAYDIRAYGAGMDGVTNDTAAQTAWSLAATQTASVTPRATSIFIPNARPVLISGFATPVPTIILTGLVGTLPRSGGGAGTSVEDIGGDLFFRAGGGNFNAAASLATVDEVGLYLRKYGVVSAMAAPHVAECIVGICAPAFSATAPIGGDIVGGEFMGQLQGLGVGGNYVGTLFGVYGHADFTGVGNSAVLDTAVGVWGDVGAFSGGSGYVVTKAVSVVARNPNPAQAGTFTTSYALYADGAVGIGAWPALGSPIMTNPPIVLSPTGHAITITPTAANAAIIINGPAAAGASAVLLNNNYTVTGSSATVAVNLAPAWNTSGAPTVLQMNVAYTAAAATAKFLDCQISGGSRFTVFASGNIQLAVDNSLTFTNQTSAAGASTGTLTNAPAATAPNFWLRVVINGTNRFIPCW